jgi:hypothetical protein
MKSKKTKPFFLLLLFLGVSIIVFGFVFSPEVVAKYVKKVETLPGYTVSKIISYQIYAIGAGCLMILFSFYILKRIWYCIYLFLY